MAQAAAMLLGLAALWFMLSSGVTGLVGLAIAIACVLAAFAGGRRLVASGGWAPARAGGWLRRLRALVRAETRTALAAIAPARRLAPAFVKIKARDERRRPALAEAAAAEIGAVVVEMEADGFLLHTLDEHAIDARALHALDEGVR